MYDATVVVLIAFFLEETYASSSFRLSSSCDHPRPVFSMYDRHLPNPHPFTPPSPLRYRIETLIGMTGLRMARFRPSWKAVVLAPLKVVWRPHLFAILWYEGVLFGLQIGLHVCAKHIVL